MTITTPAPTSSTPSDQPSAAVSSPKPSRIPVARGSLVDWRRAYHTRVVVVDAAVIVLILILAELARLIYGRSAAWHDGSGWQQTLPVAVVLGIAWLVALELQQSRDISLVGAGVDEYARVVSATLAAFGLVAVAGLLLKVPLSRGFLAVALVLGLAGVVAGRYLLRRYVSRERRSGRFITRVVVLGKPDAVRMLVERFNNAPEAGYRVVGACVPGAGHDIAPTIATADGAVPVLGSDRDVDDALGATEADACVVAAVEHLGHENMKKLAWKLESRGVGLIVVPGLTDIARPRLLMRPIDKLPLFHIASPRQEGASGAAKRTFDLAFGTFALVVASPIMVLAALAIKFDGGGPIIFRQERVGLHGKSFRIAKFRTMTVDAETRKHAERDAHAPSAIFYKSACDTRITRVGRFLRATSIDELPQFFNVLGGSMSVVGPRPLVPGEGESVEDFVARRGLVKPGITGLWQISGRSDLTEEERIRLDHTYLDSWSCVADLVIVWRTVRAVIARDGAY